MLKILVAHPLTLVKKHVYKGEKQESNWTWTHKYPDTYCAFKTLWMPAAFSLSLQIVMIKKILSSDESDATPTHLTVFTQLHSIGYKMSRRKVTSADITYLGLPFVMTTSFIQILV